MKSATIWLRGYLDEGMPGPEHFEIVESEIPKGELGNLDKGAIVVKALCFSVDPYLRGRIKRQDRKDDGRAVLQGYISGVVVASNNDSWVSGDLIAGNLPFSTAQIVPESRLKDQTWKLTGLVDLKNISYGIGVLGMPGSTAYAGVDVLAMKEGETIFISAASGAVGGILGQIAKNVYKCTTIGSCGGPEKAEMIKTKFGYDHAIDYRKASNKDELRKAIAQVAPQGIDMYFDNVGSYHLDAALASLRRKGRVAICGGIAEYNKKQPEGNLIYPLNMVYTQQRIEGFVCSEWLAGYKGNFLQDMAAWVKTGKVVAEETFYDGIQNWPIAFQSLFQKNTNRGKVVVRVGNMDEISKV